MSAALSPDARLRGVLALLAVAAGTGELSYDQLKRSFRDAALRDPLDSLAALVLGGGYLFYLAEQGQNPRCTSYTDAVLFISTCLTVGYADVFARTDAGKAIASFVMTFGPALANTALNRPAGEPDEAMELQRAILGKLDAILETLRTTP